MDVIEAPRMFQCHWCTTDFEFKPNHGGSNRFKVCGECLAIQAEFGKLIPRNLMSNYNITPIRYARMLVEQDFRCKCCRGEGKLIIDHDHRCCPLVSAGYSNSKAWKRPYSCGKCVRGLICRRCNTLVGYYETGGRELFNQVAAYAGP